MRLGSAATVAVLLTAPLIGAPAAGQSLAARIAAAPDGTVSLSFASRSDVCGNGSNISTHGAGQHDSRPGDRDTDCEHGPVRVSLRLEGRAITRIHSYVGGRWRSGTARSGLDCDRPHRRS